MPNQTRAHMQDLVRSELARRPPVPDADVETLTTWALGQRIVGSTDAYPDWLRDATDEQLAAWVAEAYFVRPGADVAIYDAQIRAQIPDVFDGAEPAPTDQEVNVLLRLVQHVLSRRSAHQPVVRRLVTSAVANVFREGRRSGESG